MLQVNADQGNAALVLVRVASSLLCLLMVPYLVKSFVRLFRPAKIHDHGNAVTVAQPPWALIGLWEALRAATDPTKIFCLMQEMSVRLGSKVYRIPMPPNVHGSCIVVVGDPDLARRILQSPTSEKAGPIFETFTKAIGGPNVFSSPTSHKLYKVVRKGTAPAFSSLQIRQRMQQIAIRHAQEWAQSIITGTDEDDDADTVVLDPTKEMLRLTFAVICEAMMEYTPTRQESDQFAANLQCALQEYALNQLINPLRKSFSAFFAQAREAQTAVQEMRRFVEGILQNYYQKRTADAGTDPSNSTCTVIRLIAENPQLQTDHQRVSELLTLLVAGHETTAHSLAFLVRNLASNPDKQQRLRSHLLNGGPNNLDDGTTTASYLDCVIKESTRINPAVPQTSVRVTGQSFAYSTAPAGKNISNNTQTSSTTRIVPKGVTVVCPQYLANRDPDIYPEPLAFQPERWMTTSKQQQTAWMPFSIGTRNCLGQALAQANLRGVLTCLISNLEFEMETPGHVEWFLSMRPVKCQLRVRKLRRG